MYTTESLYSLDKGIPVEKSKQSSSRLPLPYKALSNTWPTEVVTVDSLKLNVSVKLHKIRFFICWVIF